MPQRHENRERYKRLELKHRRTHHLRRKMVTILTDKVPGACQDQTVLADAVVKTRKLNDRAEELLYLTSIGTARVP